MGSYREQDQEAELERSRARDAERAEQERFVKAATSDRLRIGGRVSELFASASTARQRPVRFHLSTPFWLFVLIPTGTVLGGIVGDTVSDQLGTVGDLAGGLEWAFRVLVGAALGLVLSIVLALRLGRRAASHPT